MSVQIEAISSHSGKLLMLEQQMTELLALRRTLCLLNAARYRPKGSRRLYRLRLGPPLRRDRGSAASPQGTGSVQTNLGRRAS
jgi:hypothetical protein